MSEQDLIELFDNAWLIKKLRLCNLQPEEVQTALNWRPLRNFLAWAIGTRRPVELCSIKMVTGIYQLSVHNLTIPQMAQGLVLAKHIPNMKRVYTPKSDKLVYEVVVPDSKAEPVKLNWKSQDSISRPAKHEVATQVAMFDKHPIAKAKDQDLADVARALKKTEEAPLADTEIKECAFIVCADKKGKLQRGAQSCGSRSNVSVPIKCSRNSQKPVAVVHNHPSGIPIPSKLDMETAKKYNLKMCVKTEGRPVRCFIPKGEKP